MATLQDWQQDKQVRSRASRGRRWRLRWAGRHKSQAAKSMPGELRVDSGCKKGVEVARVVWELLSKFQVAFPVQYA